MELLESFTHDTFNRKIKVEMTVGELVMLMSLAGASNTEKTAKEVETKFPPFAEKIRKNNSSTKLYNDLNKIYKTIFD